MSRRKLSQRQIERIGNIQERRRRKLDERAQQACHASDPERASEGRVVARHGAHLAIMDAHQRLYHCLSRQNIGQPVCGDRVVWQPTTAGQGVVTALLKRDSVLSRPDYSGRAKALAANITQLVVVLAPAPAPSAYLLDQYLVAAESLGIAALIAVNKTDLLQDAEMAALLHPFAVYPDIGYPLVPVSARREHGLNTLVEALKTHTNILVGQSGVGKSSLIQALLPDLDLQTGRLSEATGLGRHTTSATTWYQLPNGGALIDSPGVRSFRLGQLELETLEYGYREIRTHAGHCRFANCRHGHEPGCALQAAAERGDISRQRLQNFLHMAAQLSSSARSL
jgi:ribosome biogenesis GTPase